MWKRKELKESAKKVVKRNYWTAIVVCFLVALFTGEFGTSIVGIWQNDPLDANYIERQESIKEFEVKESDEGKEVFINKEKIEKTLDETQIMVFETIEANLNSVIKSQKYVFKIFDAVKLFDLNKPDKGIILSIAAVIAFAFIVFIADPLIVAGKRYFLRARKGTNTKISVMKEIFKSDLWINVAMTMFLRNVFNALWYLVFIVPGTVKTYEYRMIPYILADNPTIKRKEAFKISREMMKGNKWRTFVLDMSFFGWNFLSVLTFGILSILYVNPYNSATMTELYVTLKDGVKQKK